MPVSGRPDFWRWVYFALLLFLSSGLCIAATETKNWRRIGTGKTVFVLISFGSATNSPQRSFPGVGYLVQDVLHARELR